MSMAFACMYVGWEDRKLFAPSRRSAAPHSPHRTWGASAELLQGTRASLRKLTMVGYLAAGLPGKLVLLSSLMESSASRKDDNRYKTSHAISQKHPKIRVEQNGKLEKLCRASVVLSSLNPVAESGVMPEGSCCNYSAPATLTLEF